MEDGVAADHLADLDLDDALVEFHRVANAVDATDGRHDGIPAATQQGRGGREPSFSISSLMARSFSMYVPLDGMYASGW